MDGYCEWEEWGIIMGSHMMITYGYSYRYDQIGKLGPNKDPGPWGLEDSLQKKWCFQGSNC